MFHLSRLGVIVVAFVAASATVAAAYVAQSGSGTYGTAKAGSLTAPSGLTAQTITTSTLKLTWTAPTEPSGATVTDWKITQTAGSPTGTGSCFTDKPSPGCTVSGLSASSTYTWKLTYYVHTWKTNETVSEQTTTVTVTATTIYTTVGTGTTESNCPAGDVAIGGGMYVGAVTGAAHPYFTGPVTGAILATAVTLATTTIKLKSGGLPFAVAKTDVLLVGTSGNLDKFIVTVAAAATATTVKVKSGTSLSGSSTIPVGSYVFDNTSTAWRPASIGSGQAPTSYGWYTLSTEMSGTETAYLLCAPASKISPVTYYEDTQNLTSTTIADPSATVGLAEASCPAGDIPLSGGIFGGNTSMAVHMYFGGPVTAALLATKVSATSTTLKLKSGGLPFAVAVGDILLVGPPTNLDRFKVKTAASAGATSVTVTSGKNLKGSTTVTPGNAVFDITSTAWRPPTGKAGTAGTTYGWYALSTYQHTQKVTAYALCVPTSAATITTIYDSSHALTATITQTHNDGVAEASCPVGDIAVGGGFYSGEVTMAAHPYFSGPVTAAILGAKVTPSSTTLSLRSGGLPAAVAANDILFVGTPAGNLDRFKVATAAAKGATSVTVKTGKNLSGGSSVSQYSYVFDISSLTWRPVTNGIGLAGTAYGWFALSTLDTLAKTETVTAYARCVVSNPPAKSAPAITSTNTTTFSVGVAGSFSVATTGYPTPTFSAVSGLPSGVTFTTATGILKGTPASGTAGTYTFTITASNGVSPNATQSFTLKVVVDQLGTPTVSTAVTYTANSTNVVVPYPSGTVANDLVFLAVSNATNMTNTFTKPANSKGTWTTLASESPGPTYELQVFYHVVSANEIPAGTESGKVTAATVTSATLFTGTKTFVGDYITDSKGGLPSKDYITAQTNTAHTATLKTNATTNEASDTFTVKPSVNYAAKTNASGASAWVVRYRTSHGTPAIASAIVGNHGMAATTFTTTKVKTTNVTATVMSFVGVDGANTLSLTTARTFTFRSSVNGSGGSPAVSTAFGLADRLVGAATTTVTGPKWKQSASKTFGYITVAFT